VVSRWLHLYLSMFSFSVVLFFAATGFTLNHADWFSTQVQTVRHAGTIPAALLKPEGSPPLPDKLGIAEYLRTTDKVHGAVAEFRTEDAQISLSFRGPGYAADATIQLPGGQYELIETRSGFVAVVNDLHKGRDTGGLWSVVIDISAVLLVLVSLTGLVLLLFLYKRRTAGVILILIGVALVLLVYRLSGF
jgi:hypothetical protein